MGADGQQGEPWVNWLGINQNLGEKKHSAPGGESSREQLPFPSLGSPLCTLTDPDKRLFKSVQLSQKFFLQLLKMYLLEIGYSLLQLKPFWFWVGKSDCLLGFTRVTNSICSIPK